MRRIPLVLGTALALGLPGAALAARADTIVVVGGPPSQAVPPAPHSTAGMRLALRPGTVSAGVDVLASARAFAAGEYVTVWDFYDGNRRVARLNGGNASAGGVLELIRTTVSVTPQGRHLLCARGERTKRVACGRYTVKGGELQSGGGSTPPKSGGGSTPPKSGGGYTPPKSDGGYTPPTSG